MAAKGAACCGKEGDRSSQRIASFVEALSVFPFKPPIGLPEADHPRWRLGILRQAVGAGLGMMARSPKLRWLLNDARAIDPVATQADEWNKLWDINTWPDGWLIAAPSAATLPIRARSTPWPTATGNPSSPAA